MTRTHLAASAAVISLIAAGLPVAGAGAQNQDEAGHAAGIYLVTTGAGGAEELVRIVGALPHEVKTTGMTKMMLTQGLLKGSTRVELAGTVADTRAPSTPTFRFYFDKPQPGSGADPFAALSQVMGGDAMPMGAKTAADFSLVHLTVTDEARQANMGKIGSRGANPKNEVKCVQERLDQGVYSLRPKAPLEPGEYAFFFSNSMGAGGGAFMAWDFGVDAPK
jgi:hypothetical protein